jgi:hypothetical protein
VRNTQSRLAVGIDTRGEGGFVPKIVPGDIAVTRRANPDGILPTVINNKAEEICSPQLPSRTAEIVPRRRICHPAPQCCLTNMAPTKSMCSCRALQERSGSTERFPQ